MEQKPFFDYKGIRLAIGDKVRVYECYRSDEKGNLVATKKSATLEAVVIKLNDKEHRTCGICVVKREHNPKVEKLRSLLSKNQQKWEELILKVSLGRVEYLYSCNPEELLTSDIPLLRKLGKHLFNEIS